MPGHLNAACMAAIRYVSSGSLASVVFVGSVSRHHEEGSSPGITDKHSPLQITASASLRFSAGSVTGQPSIGRFADISWTLPKKQPLKYRSDAQHLTGRPIRTACSDIHSCSVQINSSAAAQLRAPTHRLRHIPPHPHAAQVSRCGQRQLRAVADTPNRCHPLIPRLALPPVRLQRPPVPIVILQLHAINVVAVVVLPRCHSGIRRVHH
ncbi:regulator of sigma E protease, partial [Trypanosoma cruzi]